MDTYKRTVRGCLERLTVAKAGKGWRVTETRVRRTEDWHRVERWVRTFQQSKKKPR
jgi:hypothetical protein